MKSFTILLIATFGVLSCVVAQGANCTNGTYPDPVNNTNCLPCNATIGCGNCSNGTTCDTCSDPLKWLNPTTLDCLAEKNNCSET